MPELFKLIEKKFVDNEWRRTYELKITFNEYKITKLTITEYYQLKHRTVITDKLIWNIFHTQLDTEILKPTKYPHRKVFKWEGVYQDRIYRLIFWFKKGTTDHLWVRNCYPID